MSMAPSSVGSRTAASKADFSGIYSAPDPRPYFAALGPLHYQVPAHAEPVVASVLDHTRPVLDVCCSYGFNAAALRTTVTFNDLRQRYTEPAVARLTSAELAAADAAHFRARRRTHDVPVLGLDASAPAVGYASATGLLTDGFVEDLESADPSPRLADALGTVGTVVCTGGVGYIGTATFARLLRHLPSDVRVVVFVLRTFPYDGIRALLDAHGLVTRRLRRSFRQRRFADAAEQAAAEADVRARDLDPTFAESDGWFHADCYVSEPTV